MREVHVTANFAGQTLTAAGDGSSRESFFSGCTFGGTKFIGDWRGTTFLNCAGSVDLSGAQTHSCYWRGSTGLAGSVWPVDLGSNHHEPNAAIMLDAAATVAATHPREATILRNVAAYNVADYRHSWDDAASVWWTGATAGQRAAALAVGRQVFATFPDLLARWNKLAADLASGRTLYAGNMPLAVDLVWPDGVAVHVDAAYVAALAEKSLYGLARKIEADAGPGRFVHAYSGLPPLVRIMPSADYWLVNLWTGF